MGPGMRRSRRSCSQAGSGPCALGNRVRSGFEDLHGSETLRLLIRRHVGDDAGAEVHQKHVLKRAIRRIPRDHQQLVADWHRQVLRGEGHALAGSLHAEGCHSAVADVALIERVAGIRSERIFAGKPVIPPLLAIAAVAAMIVSAARTAAVTNLVLLILTLSLLRSLA